MPYTPDSFSKVARSEAYVAATREGMATIAAELWDSTILREPRICVPIDVQALVVAAGTEAETAGVRLIGPLSPGALVTAASTDEAHAAAVTGPAPFAAAEPREPGVHLHWALPDSLLTATLHDSGEGTAQRAARQSTASVSPDAPNAAGGGLGMRALPDRWVVLRLMLPTEGDLAVSAGWIVDALTGRAWPIEQFSGDTGGADAATAAIPSAGLTGTAGGTATWTGGYDAAQGRFTFHDPLHDLSTDPTLGGTLPGGPFDDRATYLVVGWWSAPDLDPLDDVRSTGALDRRLGELAWYRTAPDEPEPSDTVVPKSTESLGGAHLSHVDYAIPKRTTSLPGLVAASTKSVAGGYTRVPPARPPRPEASTLVHGAVLGVPVSGSALADTVIAADQRPRTADAQIAWGTNVYDAVGAMTAARLAQAQGGIAADERDTIERLLTAFLQRSLHTIGEPGGASAIEDAMHAGGFASVPSGEPGIEDRLVDDRVSIPARSRRIGTAAPRKYLDAMREESITSVRFARERNTALRIENMDVAKTMRAAKASSSSPLSTFTPPPSRTVVRPTPSRWVPADPAIVIRGAGRSLRHGGDGRWSRDGKLFVRHPSQIPRQYQGLITGDQVLAAIASGGIPGEATALAREALLLSPHAERWLARRAAELAGSRGRKSTKQIGARFSAEMLLRYDSEGRYGAAEAAAASLSESRPTRRADVVSSMLSHGPTAATGTPGSSVGKLPRYDVAIFADAAVAQSVLDGIPPSKVGLTPWSQPWNPMWLEFDAEVSGTDGTLTGWQLDEVDFTAPAAVGGSVVREFTSRVPLTSGAARAVGGVLREYLADENLRDEQVKGEIDEETERDLADLAAMAEAPDLLGASLDGLRRRLLGLSSRRLNRRLADGTIARDTVDEDAAFLVAGEMTLRALRIVDTFGRVLDLDPDAAVVPARLESTGGAAALLRAPRFSLPTRVQMRLVGADAASAADAVDARVDEAEPQRAVSPVAGFLLPDHVDESIEIFTSDGTPVGEVLVEGSAGPSGGGVVWEPAPGRPVPHDAAPGTGLAPQHSALGAFATGLVRADAAARAGESAAEGADSALSALIRAIDTTLWSIDPVSGAGSAQVASIVGRPLAVVRAIVSVDIASDLDDLELDAATRAAREAAVAELAAIGVPVRLGELTRPDDGLVAWFADDDYSQVHVVDASVADMARPLGPGRGFLTAWGLPPEEWTPGSTPIEHPYLVKESTLEVHPGAPRVVTLLMAPGASVFFTSGVVPRGRVQLQRSWFADALDTLIPSIRVGPVLVDPGEVKLPLVAALGEHQVLTSREGPTAWRDDAILAATQSAALPDRANVLREGWVRVAPASDIHSSE